MEILDFPTIFIILVAVAVLLVLRSVLGQRTGYERQDDIFQKEARRQQRAEDESNADNVVKLPTRKNDDDSDEDAVNPVIKEIDDLSEPDSKLNAGMKAVAAVDSSFSPSTFLDGGNMAYEMIVNAFADADETSLRNLLSADVFEGFKAAIEGRQERGETVKSSFVGIDTSEIVNADVQDNEAQVTVRFESQIISATYDKDEKLIEGSDNDVARVIDIWTFARDIRSRDPNWKLVATEAEG